MMPKFATAFQFTLLGIALYTGVYLAFSKLDDGLKKGKYQPCLSLLIKLKTVSVKITFGLILSKKSI